MGDQIARWNRRQRGLRIGQPVTILRLPMDGPPYIECRAVLGACENGLCHRVQFDGEPGWRRRAIHPALQTDADWLAAALIELWRAEQALNASFADFFPPANTDD